MSRLTGYELMETTDGNLLQAGVKSRADVAHLDVSNTMGWITRAVVLKTYYADEDDRNGWVQGKQRCILCDVRTYGRYSRPLKKVPLLQRTHGLWDQDIYIPRNAAVDIEGGDLVSEPSGKKSPTSAEKLDGDHVLVGFLDNDPAQPVILPYQFAHPSSNYTPEQADGRVRRIRHNGVLVEWDKDGNLTIDATEAAKPGLKKDGTEDSNSGTSGKITIKTKDSADAESQFYLDEVGGVLVEAGGGTCKVELVKDTTALMEAKTIGTVKGGTKVILDAPLVELSTAPLEPVIKATTYNLQEATMLGQLLAAVKGLETVFKTWGALATGAPAAAPVLGAVIGAPSKVAEPLMTAAAAAIQTFTGGSAAWTSTKVQTG